MASPAIKAMPASVISTMDRPAALVARLVREVIRDVSGRTPKTPFTPTPVIDTSGSAQTDPPAGWLVNTAVDETTGNGETCPVCFDDTILPPPPCAVAAAVEGMEYDAAKECAAMCFVCVTHSITSEISDRVYGAAPVRCPGTCRRSIPSAAWSVYVATGANVAAVEATITEMKARRARGGDIAESTATTKAAEAAAEAAAVVVNTNTNNDDSTAPTTTTAAAAAATTTATVPPPVWNDFNKAAEKVTSLRCPGCDETRSWIDDVQRLGRDEVAGDAASTKRRAACTNEIESMAKETKWFKPSMLKNLNRASRGFARYTVPATELAACVAEIAFGPDYTTTFTDLTWENNARAFAWLVLSLCPDPERRASLALALIRHVPRVTLENCCWMNVCVACQAEDSHTGLTCAENEGSMEGYGSGIRSCPECGVALFRSEGCDDMTCAACMAVFNWDDAAEIA